MRADAAPEDFDTQQVIREVHHHHGANGSNKIVWTAAATFGLALLTIAGVALAKVYDMSDRLMRVETYVEVLMSRKP